MSFLNYRNGEFGPAEGTYNDKGFLHTDINRIDYSILIELTTVAKINLT